LIVKIPGGAMALITRLLVAVTGLTIVLLGISDSAEPAKQTKRSLANASRPEKKPIHLVVRSRADIKQIFTYTPYPVVPSELQGYEGTQMGGTGTYRLSVDAQGAVTQVTILKGFVVTAVYDDRFSNSKGNPVPGLDKVMLQALSRWRAKPGPTRVVDIYWSFGMPGVPRSEALRLFPHLFCLCERRSDGERICRTASHKRRLSSWTRDMREWQSLSIDRCYL
jgi:hypothetical protein